MGRVVTQLAKSGLTSRSSRLDHAGCAS